MELTNREQKLAIKIAEASGENAVDVALAVSERAEKAGFVEAARSLVRIAMWLIGVGK